MYQHCASPPRTASPGPGVLVPHLLCRGNVFAALCASSWSCSRLQELLLRMLRASQCLGCPQEDPLPSPPLPLCLSLLLAVRLQPQPCTAPLPPARAAAASSRPGTSPEHSVCRPHRLTPALLLCPHCLPLLQRWEIFPCIFQAWQTKCPSLQRDGGSGCFSTRSRDVGWGGGTAALGTPSFALASPAEPSGPTPCTAAATCAGSPAGSRPGTRSRASPAALGPPTWKGSCCSPPPPRSLSARVSSAWAACLSVCLSVHPCPPWASRAASCSVHGSDTPWARGTPARGGFHQIRLLLSPCWGQIPGDQPSTATSPLPSPQGPQP